MKSTLTRNEIDGSIQLRSDLFATDDLMQVGCKLKRSAAKQYSMQTHLTESPFERRSSIESEFDFV